MDKKNTTIGLLCFIAGMALMIYTQPQSSPPAPTLAEPPAPADPSSPPVPVATEAPTPSVIDGSVAPAEALKAPEQASTEPIQTTLARTPRIRLENEFIAADISPLGAGVYEVYFKQTDPNNDVDAYVFNQNAIHPALALYFDQGNELSPFLSEFLVIAQTNTSISLQWDSPKGDYSIRRTYTLNEDTEKSYLIDHSTTLINHTDSAIQLPQLFFSLGTAYPLESDPGNQYLNVSAYAAEDLEKIAVNRFTGSGGVFGIGAITPVPFVRETYNNVRWMAVKNQYFAAAIIPDAPKASTTLYSEGAPYGSPFVAGARSAGSFGAASFDAPVIPANAEAAIDFGYYVGPKEYNRLRDLDVDAEKLMEFGPFFGWISELLLLAMTWFHGFVGNWGVAIIMITLSIKLIFWIPTSKGIRVQKITAKRMQGIAEPMKAMREKYSDNPQKLQKEMMALYQKNNVNPLAMAAGCLPILIQMPVFFGLFGMLKTASELRLSGFLWVDDLAQPDMLYIFPEAIPLLGGFAFNILPILYGATSYLQMRMMPQPTATMDEQQLMMQKMMRFMPWIFVIFLYKFAAALSLYWIANNLLSMLQLFFVNRSVQPELDKIDEEQAEKKVSEAKPVGDGAAKLRKKKRSKDS